MAGLALRAGHMAVGEDAAFGLCGVKGCRLLLTAADAAPKTLRRAEAAAHEGQCLLLRLPYGKEELGHALGRPQCAAAAVSDVGLALAIAEGLAGQDPERYSPAAERLRVKKERAAQRKEQRGCRKKIKKKKM